MAVPSFQCGSLPSRKRAWTTLSVPGMVISPVGYAPCTLASAGRALALDAGEEGGVLPELRALPLGEGVVVTLGALQLHAEEQPGRAAAARFSGLNSLAW